MREVSVIVSSVFSARDVVMIYWKSTPRSDNRYSMRYHAEDVEGNDR